MGASRSAPGLYLHIPFCSAICPYCDFAVTTGGRERRARFVDALVAEIELGAPVELERPIDTVYFGGGTPSSLRADDLGRVLEAVAAHLPLAAEPWITLEANPEDVSAESAAAWRGLGVRTLSLGVQSFAAENLRFLGRRHGRAEAVASVETAHEAGFDTVSVDLIFGLPEQSQAAWRADLESVAALAPQHVSCYQLTLHEGTPFGVRRARGELAEMGEGDQARLFELAHRILGAGGLEAYEVSNFAAGCEHRSRHNGKYWDHTPYLGLGPSAHSFAGRRRWWNERRLETWAARLTAGERPVAGEEALTAGELALERLLLGLRTADGIDLDRFARRYGVDLVALNQRVLDELETAGKLVVDGRRLRPTRAGLAVADGLARRLEVEPKPAATAGGAL